MMLSKFLIETIHSILIRSYLLKLIKHIKGNCAQYSDFILKSANEYAFAICFTRRKYFSCNLTLDMVRNRNHNFGSDRQH